MKQHSAYSSSATNKVGFIKNVNGMYFVQQDLSVCRNQRSMSLGGPAHQGIFIFYSKNVTLVFRLTQASATIFTTSSNR